MENILPNSLEQVRFLKLFLKFHAFTETKIDRKVFGGLI